VETEVVVSLYCALTLWGTLHAHIPEDAKPIAWWTTGFSHRPFAELGVYSTGSSGVEPEPKGVRIIISILDSNPSPCGRVIARLRDRPFSKREYADGQKQKMPAPCLIQFCKAGNCHGANFSIVMWMGNFA